MEATYRLQTNDENWHQIWKEDGEGRELPYCEIVNTDKETVAEVFRAVNTFGQAREALKLARRRLNEGMHGKIDAVMEHDGDPGIVKLLDEALAAMEATHE